MRKYLWLLIALLLAMALVTACGGGQEAATPAGGGEQAAGGEEAAAEPVEIDIWFHSGKGAERDALNATLEEFNNTHEDVQVNAVKLPEGSYNDQINAAALAGDLPCALDFDGPFLYNYAWSGYLMPLDEYLSDEMRNDFLPSIIEQGTYADSIYGLGQFDSGLAIWGNREYLEEAGVRIPEGVDDPWTKEEFMSALESLQALDQVEYAIDFKMNYGQGEWYTYGFTPILWSHGGHLIDRESFETADGYLNSEASVEAMTLFQTLFQEGYANPEPAGDDDFYINNIAALSWVGHWMWGPHNENMGDNLVLIPVPDFGEGPKTGMGSWQWGITQNCSNPDAAWQWLDFLLSKDEILRMTNGNGAIPARQSAIEESELYGPEGPMSLMVDQIEAGWAVPRPRTPAYPVITNSFATAVQNIVSGADVKAELDKAVQKIDQDIEDNRGYPEPES